MKQELSPRIMLRDMVALAAGLIVGMAFNMALVILNAKLHAPEDLNMGDPEQVQRFIDTMPASGLLLVLVAHVGQAALGGWVAARLSVSRPLLMALLVGFATVAGSVQMLTTYTSPAWMWVEVPLALGLAWWAGNVHAKRQPRT